MEATRRACQGKGSGCPGWGCCLPEPEACFLCQGRSWERQPELKPRQDKVRVKREVIRAGPTNDDDDDEDEDNEIDDARCIAWRIPLHHFLDDTIYAPTRKRRRPDDGSTISAFLFPLCDTRCALSPLMHLAAWQRL
jgi:hypothetical protein